MTSLASPQVRSAWKALALAAVLAVILAATPRTSSAAPPSKPDPVVVTNPAGSPVPVAVQGTPEVAIPGTVQVAGTVRAAPAGQLVQMQRGLIIEPAGTLPPTRFPFYDVPDGKRLVVEQMTAHLVMGSGAEMYVRVGPATGPLHVLAFPGGLDANSETNLLQRSSTTQQMTFFVDAVEGSTTPEFHVEIMRLSDTSNEDRLAQTFTMVGRLYDL